MSVRVNTAKGKLRRGDRWRDAHERLREAGLPGAALSGVTAI
jgi:hypothetical protein